MFSYFDHLECSACLTTYASTALMNLCACGAPLLARYRLEEAAAALDREQLEGQTLWRYHAMLPVQSPAGVVSLGEGMTPLLRAERLGKRLGLNHLYIKDESLNPTGSFKARGLALAIARAAELGVTRVAVPSAGNAGGATAAYAARAGLESYIFMPRDVPRAFIVECQINGAHVELVDGLITDAGRRVAAGRDEYGWFDLSTLKEPYRVEGKKTMGYELAEQCDLELPHVIIYPTGGGTGLIGMWKSFDEMEQMGWIGSKRPRMVTVQASGCAPIVNAFAEGKQFAEEFPNAATAASGLRVPKAIGDFLILDAIRASGGTAVAVTDEELLAATREIGAAEGIFCAPEGAACLPALRKLLTAGEVKAEERVVLFNTGAGVKYIEAFSSDSD